MALLVVLLIVMAATILSLGFLSRSNVELACGENMILRTQMDYLAESGLEHARGLILNDNNSLQDWTALGQQLVDSSNDYYDVTVSRDDPNLCNYIITCDAYREKNGERIGRSSLQAELRLDPCIAFWVGVGTTIGQRITINGDVYCDAALGNSGTIQGDVFANGNITNTGSITGQMYPNGTKPIDVNWPGLAISDFSSQYYHNGSGPYPAQIVDGNYSDVTWGSLDDNPPMVFYHDGDLELEQNVIINGTLVVNGKLIISGPGNRITAAKNFPAIIIGNHLDIEGSGGITVEGLIQSEGEVHIKDVNNAVINIIGALFTKTKGFRVGSSLSFTITITAAPAIASIQTWPTPPGNPVRWTPAGGAFFRSIERK